MRTLNEIPKYVVFSAMSLGLFFSTPCSYGLAAQEKPAVKGERIEVEERKAGEEQKAWESYANCILGKIKEANALEAKAKGLGEREKRKSRYHHGIITTGKG